MLVCNADSETEVALRIGAVDFNRYSLLTIARHKYIGIHPRVTVDCSHRLHLYIDELCDTELSESCVCTVDIGCVVGLTGVYIALFLKSLRFEIAVMSIKYRYAFIVCRVNGMCTGVFTAQFRIVVCYEYHAPDIISAVVSRRVGSKRTTIFGTV